MRRVGIVILAVGMLAAGCSRGESGSAGLTFGTIPESVFDTDGPIEAEALPDYVAVASPSPEGGIVGYVRAWYVVPVIGHEDDFWSDDPIPVVDKHLNLVGHMVPGKGFVPVGSDLDEVPDLVVTTIHSPPVDP